MKDIHQFLCSPAEATHRHGPHDRIVMSSRVRLARNLREHAFPGWAKKTDRQKSLESIKTVARNLPEMKGALVRSMDEFTAIEQIG